MAKRMLIDAAHPEETRVVVLNGHRLEEFDFETSTKKQIKGNIYLAKVTRVEPSLQAAFVEYGGNRHGFLAFGEIHPDYYRIPVADRRAALEANRAAEAAADEREERHVEAGETEPERLAENAPAEILREPEDFVSGDDAHDERLGAEDQLSDETLGDRDMIESAELDAAEAAMGHEPDQLVPDPDAPRLAGDAFAEDDAVQAAEPLLGEGEAFTVSGSEDAAIAEAEHPLEAPAAPTPIETVGGDEFDESQRRRARPFRHYKIQEVVKRRQIMLVQVTKEERGNKGAALTTYISLAGRYCVLMPNTPRGGGVSRKITSMTDRRRLKDLMSDLEVPEGMGVIVRTAGSERSKVEIKRDFEYLLRLWDDIRELTLKSTAPALIYEEGNLIKRSIRDLYARDIDEVLVDGRDGYDTAKSFMRMLMPSHAQRVKFYNDPSVPLFHRFQVESQIDAIHSPVVQLRSGGYIVMNPTEALVAIDVNSGRSTRERNIEETAFKTNLEAAEEVARQLRLRDLAGLIVIDFIDMEEHRNNGAVERRLKEAMRHDRARIQLGRISPFGLLELSRQRLRPSLLEASTEPCPHCGGTGHIRSTESTALHVLRAIEEEGMRRRSAEITVAVPSTVALYILNQKRGALSQSELRYGFRVTVTEDDVLVPPAFRLERIRALTPAEIAALPVLAPLPVPVEEEAVAPLEDEDATAETELRERGAPSPRDAYVPPESVEEEAVAAPDYRSGHAWEDRGEGAGEGHGDGHGRGRRRRRRRRRGGDRMREGGAPLLPAHAEQAPQESISENGYEPQPEENLPEAAEASGTMAEDYAAGDGQGEAGDHKRRRRGRRGGRRRRRGQAHDRSPEGGDSYAGHAQGPMQEPAESGEATPSFAVPREVEPETAMPDSPTLNQQPAPPPPREEPASAAAEPERASAAYNVPPAQEVSGPPTKPKRGWWRR